MNADNPAGSGGSRQMDYRARVTAMYQRYCPEKPLSHVDYLLTKYKGFEEELMEVLVEKYGPEPQSRAAYAGAVQSSSAESYASELVRLLGPERSTSAGIDATLQRYQGVEEALLYATKVAAKPSESQSRYGLSPYSPDGIGTLHGVSLLREADTNRESAFAANRSRFHDDVRLLQRERQHHAAHQLQESITAAQETIAQQEKEIRMLRSDLQATRLRAEAANGKQMGAIQRLAGDVARSKLEALRLEGLVTPGVAPLHQLQQVERETESVGAEILKTLETLFVYERVIRAHLAMYPVTPVRSKLREVDPTLCARLDSY